MSVPMYTRAREPSLSVMIGQAVQEVIEHLFALGGGLLRDAIADLGRWREDTAVVADLGEAA